jgi:hypothetical protein
MIDFKLAYYLVLEVRHGQSYDLEIYTQKMCSSEELIVYRDDVWTYYYIVPKSKLKNAGLELLEFFYQDNHDYTDEQLIDFKSEYPNIF